MNVRYNPDAHRRRSIRLRNFDYTMVGAYFVTVPHPLSEIVRAFKTFSARRINAQRETPGTPAWQRNYYEHVIRDEVALSQIRNYIVHNPAKWDDDPDNPRNVSPHRRYGRVSNPPIR